MEPPNTQRSGMTANSKELATTTLDMVRRLLDFQGAPDRFLGEFLAAQCRNGAAEAGAVLRMGDDNAVEVLALHPDAPEDDRTRLWLSQAMKAAPRAPASGETVVKGLDVPDALYGQEPARHMVLIPMAGEGWSGVCAFLLNHADAAGLAQRRERLELAVPLLRLYETRSLLKKRDVDVERLSAAVETLAAANRHDRFMAAAMALCNEVASRWQCDRTGLGFLKGRYVVLKAMSHTEKFSRRMKVVGDIEAAMEECLDQDEEILFPAPVDATVVSRAARELSVRHGPNTVCAFPLRSGGATVAVLTVERTVDKPLDVQEIASIRLALELCTPLLAKLYDRDRWIGARAAGALRRVAAAVVGPRHTWHKLAGVAVFAVVAFLIFAKGAYRAEAPFVLKADVQRMVPAPFDGHLESVSVRPGDRVEGGKTVLAALDTSELRLQLAAAKAERVAHLKRGSAELRDEKMAQAQIARAQARKMDARIRLLESRIDEAALLSPIDGCVVVGDLKRRVGAPVEQGDILFQVAALDSLIAELFVAEGDIADVTPGQSGELATAAFPARRIEFTVERISPVAKVVDRKNVFEVRVRLGATYPWMRPGMEGIAKIAIDRRSHGAILAKPVVDWLRMKLWL